MSGVAQWGLAAGTEDTFQPARLALQSLQFCMQTSRCSMLRQLSRPRDEAACPSKAPWGSWSWSSQAAMQSWGCGCSWLPKGGVLTSKTPAAGPTC